MEALTNSKVALAGMTVLAACGEVPPDLTSNNEGDAIGAGRIVDVDSGNGQKVQPRNKPCMCGSGKKAKKCCVYIKTETDKQSASTAPE